MGASASVSDTAKWRPGPGFWWVYASLALSMLLSALDQTIVATALPTVVGDLGSVSLMSWVVTVYTLAVTISMPVYGKLGDLLGRRRLYIAALALFVSASALCGLSQNVGQLIVFRAIQGFGGGGLMVLSQAILAELIPPGRGGPVHAGQASRRKDGCLAIQRPGSLAPGWSHRFGPHFVQRLPGQGRNGSTAPASSARPRVAELMKTSKSRHSVASDRQRRAG